LADGVFPWTGRRDALPEEVNQALAEGQDFEVLDVRTEPEYRAYHIPGARLVPMDNLGGALNDLDPDTNWVVVCEHGIRSRAAAQWLAQQGFESVANMVGGMASWPGPVEKGRE
jgi:rhodanese-related sulfurtransferase